MDLAERARRYLEHPARGTERPDGWDRFLASGAREIEELRRRFPLERVERARAFLGLGHGNRPRRSGVLDEQIYRAHYSSMKVQWSWSGAAAGLLVLGHLYGLVDDGILEAGRVERDEQAELLTLICETLWPEEELESVLATLVQEDWHGHIPLRSSVLALGSKLVFADYAVGVVTVLRKLHRNSAYTYGLCRGRTLSWAEAVVFKTLPRSHQKAGHVPPSRG